MDLHSSLHSAIHAVYAKVSGLGIILDHSEHVDVFLESNVDSLGAIVSVDVD
jgi:hypothetical protein